MHAPGKTWPRSWGGGRGSSVLLTQGRGSSAYAAPLPALLTSPLRLSPCDRPSGASVHPPSSGSRHFPAFAVVSESGEARAPPDRPATTADAQLRVLSPEEGDRWEGHTAGDSPHQCVVHGLMTNTHHLCPLTAPARACPGVMPTGRREASPRSPWGARTLRFRPSPGPRARQSPVSPEPRQWWQRSIASHRVNENVYF